MDVRGVELRARFGERLPAGRAGAGFRQQQLFADVAESEMADVGAGEAAAADDAVARNPGPAGFDEQGADSVVQGDELADHRRVADTEAMIVVSGDLNAPAVAVRFAGGDRKSLHQPANAGCAQQVVGIFQRQILGHIFAACEARLLLRL